MKFFLQTKHGILVCVFFSVITFDWFAHYFGHYSLSLTWNHNKNKVTTIKRFHDLNLKAPLATP